MDTEKKIISIDWNDKVNPNSNGNYMVHDLYEYNYYLVEAMDRASSAMSKLGNPISYKDQETSMDKFFSDREIIRDYVTAMYNHILGDIDNELKKGFDAADGPTELLSLIKMENFTVENTFAKHIKIYTATQNGSSVATKPRLDLGDFIGGNDGQRALQVTQVGVVDEFADIFKQQYDGLLKSGMIDKDLSLDDYLDAILAQGEFNHKFDKPIAGFFSSVLDVIFVKPLLEALIGYDLITWDDLTVNERGLKALAGIIGAITFGASIVKDGVFAMSGDAIASYLAKKVAIDLGNGVKDATLDQIMDALNLPPAAQILILNGVDFTISFATGEMTFRNPETGAISRIQLSKEALAALKETVGMDDLVTYGTEVNQLTDGQLQDSTVHQSTK